MFGFYIKNGVIAHYNTVIILNVENINIALIVFYFSIQG